MNLPVNNKRLGQHFLKDKRVINAIASDFHDKAEVILEVGAGPGNLSGALLAINRPFKAIEKDRRFSTLLNRQINPETLLFADALKLNFPELIQKWGWTGQKVWLVSNLPYNAATPLLIKFIKTSDIHYMTLMFQKEVAEKIISPAKQKTKKMNSLQALCQTYFDIKRLIQVPSAAFSPAPKVDSSVLSFVRKQNPAVSLEQFSNYEKFLRSIFQFKRKQIKNNFKTLIPMEKIDKTLQALKIDPTQRAETLLLDDIHFIYKNI